jgi:cryptochrome
MLQGGETLALKRMEEHIADKAWVVQFEKPKGNPAALEPATTVLSPYLKFGCLSVRVFYKRLQEVSCPTFLL